MPCRCDFEPSVRGSVNSPEYTKLQNQYNALLKEANWATRSACDMRTILRRMNLERELTGETRKWIEKHDREDARRIQEEEARGERQKVKKEALEKLTDDEKAALGIIPKDVIMEKKRLEALEKLSLEERRVLGL
jgi:hypothetical protein